LITQEELKEQLDYNPETGIFTWKKLPEKRPNNGIAGSLDNRGYTYIRINKKLYLAHRLAWLYVYGEWPQNNIDHINGIKYDNRIENLRDIPQRENCQNYTIHRNGKLVGCYFNKNAQKWQARIRVKGRLKHIGYYNTEQEAHQVYMNEVNKLNENPSINKKEKNKELTISKNKLLLFPFDKRLQKYIVYSKINGKLTRIGAFDTEKQAREAYLNKRKWLKK
jgi:hypothetical protein